VSGSGLRDPGWDTDSEEAVDLDRILTDGDSTDGEEFVRMRSNRTK
jgi:hypothetical protein